MQLFLFMSTGRIRMSNVSVACNGKMLLEHLLFSAIPNSMKVQRMYSRKYLQVKIRRQNQRLRAHANRVQYRVWIPEIEVNEEQSG